MSATGWKRPVCCGSGSLRRAKRRRALDGCGPFWRRNNHDGRLRRENDRTLLCAAPPTICQRSTGRSSPLWGLPQGGLPPHGPHRLFRGRPVHPNSISAATRFWCRTGDEKSKTRPNDGEQPGMPLTPLSTQYSQLVVRLHYLYTCTAGPTKGSSASTTRPPAAPISAANNVRSIDPFCPLSPLRGLGFCEKPQRLQF